MNQVHKVIWSRVKNCYIVVSEITKRVGRDNKASVTGIRPLRALLCAMVIAGCMFPADADAAGGIVWGTGASAPGQDSAAIGIKAKAEEEYALAMGYKAIARGKQSLAIGREANAIGNNSIAAGAEAKGYAKDGIAIGNNAESGTANNKDPRIPSIESNNGVAVGNSAKARGGSSVSVGNDSFGNGPSSVAIGNAATANDVRTTAIGNNAHAEGAGSLSIGREASALTLENATSTNPLVTGTDEKLDKKGVMAIGDDAMASGNNSIALGTSAKAGYLEKTRNEDSVTMTGSAKRITKLTSTRSVNNAVAIGTESSVQSDEDIAVGYRAATVRSKYHQLPGSGQVAIGSNSNTYGSRGDVAIGSGAETNIRVKNVDHTNGPTEKRDAQSVAIGSVAKAYGSQAVAVGADTRAIGNSSVAIGTDDIELDRAKLQSLLPGLANNENLNNKAPSDATLGSAALHDKPYYVKTASIGTASVALGAMSQAAGDASMAMGLNALAEGDASTAIGPLARSKGKKSIAMGVNANSQVDGGVALGADSVSNRQQTSNAYIPSGAGAAQVNAINATKGTTGAVSVGSDTVKRQIINVAAGTNDSDAVNVAQLKAVTSNASWTAQGNGNDVNAVKNGSKVNFADGTNTTASVTKDASGKVTTVKYNLKKDVDLGPNGSLTINGNTYINKDGINAGNKQITNVASGGNVTTNAANIGDINRIVKAKDKYVTGGTADYQANGDGTATLTGTNGLTANVTGLKNNYVTSGSVSNDGKTLTLERNDTGKVNVDLSKIFTEVAKEDYHLVANPEAGSQGKYKADSNGNMVLTVANEKGDKKQVTLTDIASKAQQNTNTTNITNINNTIAKGLNFGGDSGADINKKLGEKLEIKGGASADLTDGNIGVVSDGTKLNVKLKKDVDLGPNGSLTINGKTYVNKDGLNANSQKITNVADGTANSDAVNLGQLNAAIGGTAKATTVKAKDANVTVTEGTNPAGGKEYTVGLGDKVTLGTADKKIVVDGTSGKITAGSKVTIDGTTGDIQAGTVKVTGAGTVNELTNRTWDIDNPTVVHGQAATEDQLKTVSDGVKTNKTDITNINTTIGKGLNFKGDDATVINKKLGEQLDIKGGADASKLSDGNIGVVSGNGALNIKLAKDVKVDSVTTGNTVINNNGLTVGGKTYVTNNGINANNQKVTNVADGQVAAGSKDAVNGGQLHDAKNEVINKGLRFDADNNSEKTNKLGSKVTVNGDNNITTEITQTGDDTKIGVKLKEDIHVKTVTATDTVKAGGVTMGSQTSGGTTGNYVTGLDNKTWNVTNPTAVSGRAATEDQLKTVTEAINNQSAAATDYRLVRNASSADGSYTVDTNGNIDLTVEDKNHAGQKETVKLKDIASKSKLDDVIAKGLQFDANAGGTKTNKLGSKITVKGEGTAADTEYSGENLKTFITQDPAGNTTIDVKMNKNLKVETIVATGENGKDGKIGINGKDGQTTNISVTRDGKPGVDGAPGTTTTRIVYEKPDGTKEEVATLNDGMKYGGDTGAVIKKKLNEQVNVVGGITDENKLTTEDNLGVVSDGNNNLKVRLAKALKGLESITAGDTFINNNGITISNGAAGNTVSLTKNGLDNGGNKITNVAAGDVSANSTDAVNGSQLHDVKTLAGQHTTVKAKDSNITVTEGTNGTGGKEYTVGLGDKVTLGTDPSKQVSIDGTTGIIKAGDKVTIDGTTGNIDAGKVKINGKDGTVNGLTNKTWDPNNITSGQAATEDQLKAVDQKITNTSEELTKKGMDFAGNDGEFHRNLGDKVTIKGEGTKAASEYSGENIKTFADANGNLTVKMDKNLKTETIVATGKNGKDGKIGINGKDGVTTNISVTRDGKPGVDGAPGATTTRIVYEKPDGTKEEVATLNDGMKYGGDTGNVIKKKLNEQVNVVGGITDTNKLTTEDNLGVVSDGNNNLKVRMAKDLKGLNSVTTNTLTVGDVKIDNSGINAGNKKITNVAAGDISANSTDAVNGGQLWKTNQTINNIGGAVNELGDRMDRVGAGAAALAALHPLDFDPDDKWDVAAGYGNYKDAHAVAVGAFYRPNEDTMFSVGGSFGGGENMVNAGVSVKLGQGNHVSTSKVAMAKEIVDLKDAVTRLEAQNEQFRQIIG